MYTKSQLIRISTYAGIMHKGWTYGRSEDEDFNRIQDLTFLTHVAEALCMPEVNAPFAPHLSIALSRLLAGFGTHLVQDMATHPSRSSQIKDMRRRFQDFIVADNLAKRMEVRRAEPPKYVNITYTDSYGPRPAV